MENNRNSENDSKLYQFNIKLTLIGYPDLEQEIDTYLKDCIEKKFLSKKEERVGELFIDSIYTYHGI